MLPKENRLKTSSDFDFVKSEGKIFHSKSFGLLVSKKTNSVFKVGIVISTKVFKRAVDRNNKRRTINRILRKNISVIKDGFNVIFLVKKNIESVNIETLEKEIITVFKKAEIVK